MFAGKLDHVGHVVNDFDKALELYQNKLGLKPRTIMEFKELGSRMAFFPFGGMEIEVIKPGGKGPDPAYRCLQERGEGVFHLSMLVDNYDDEVKKWREKGFTIGEYTHKTPERVVRIAFFEPKEIMGLWVELIEGEKNKTLKE